MSRSEVIKVGGAPSLPGGGGEHLPAVGHADLRAARRALMKVKMEVVLYELQDRLFAGIKAVLTVPRNLFSALMDVAWYIHECPLPNILKRKAFALFYKLFKAFNFFCELTHFYLRLRGRALRQGYCAKRRAYLLFRRQEVIALILAHGPDGVDQLYGSIQKFDAELQALKRGCEIHLAASCRGCPHDFTTRIGVTGGRP